MKLHILQHEIKAPKRQFNSFGKYKYRSCEDIAEAVKPILYDHGFSLILTDTIELIGNRFYVKATATITNGTETYSATAYAREEEVKKGMDGSQITGASSSYARKYALNGLFAIDDTKDADATNQHDEKEPPKTTLYNRKPTGDSDLPLISNAQFKTLCARVDKGDKEAGEKAKTVFSFEATQLNLLNQKISECQTN